MRWLSALVAALVLAQCRPAAAADSRRSLFLDLGSPAPVPADANITKAVEVAVKAMNVRLQHFCPHQGRFTDVALVSAAREVVSDSPLYELRLKVDGKYDVMAYVMQREDVDKLTFLRSLPYCCSVRSSDLLANNARDVEKHNADPDRSYDQALYKQFSEHTYSSLANKYLGLLRRPNGDFWLDEPQPMEKAGELEGTGPALEKGRSRAKSSGSGDGYDTRTAYPQCKMNVRNQGSCGSCWAQSSAAVMEDRLCIATK
ncbi:hypothetical protein T492DRAFT_877785 [Pavlovales sp. CCMP2436]|nr:hypothetical protein T492DRAFT_877785 [Pavlovales sp. CCMP2436]